MHRVSPDECEIFDLHGKQHHLTIICYDRSTIDSRLQGDAYYQCIAEEITKKVTDKTVDFIGFSIGAFIALQVCRAMNGKVRSLHLVSGSLKVIRRHFYGWLAYKDGLRVSFAACCCRMLFSSAADEDKVLAADKTFRIIMTRTLKTCFQRDSLGYARDITAYVQPWKATLAEISVDTHSWHGAKDNWSPVAMADYLALALPLGKRLSIFTTNQR